jgi:hypothetical protein
MRCAVDVLCVQVSLEAGSASQASAWLYAIDAALRGYSQRRFHHTEADPKAARYYVDGINAPNKYLVPGTVVMDAAAPAAEAKSEAVGGASAAGAASGTACSELRAHTLSCALSDRFASNGRVACQTG